MSLERIRGLATRIVTQFRRDHRSVGLLFMVPLVLMTLVGLLLDIGQRPLRIGLVDQASDLNVAQIGARVEIQRLEQDEALDRLRAQKLDAVLRTSGSGVELFLEGTNPSTSRAVLAAVSQVAVPGTQPPPAFRVHYLFAGPQFDSLDYFAPVVIAAFAFLLVFMLTAVSFLRERRGGTLERLLSTPIRRVEIVLGYMLGLGLFAMLQSLVILLYALLVLRVRYAGSPWLVFFVTAVLTVGAVNLGIALSALATTELQVVQFIPMVLVPQVLLGEVVWPASELPRGLDILAQLMPLTHANRALRDIMLRGAGLSGITGELGFLVVFAGLMVGLAALTLSREAT
jgi:ABC-2 type transport system permease protein